jgi:hypothetical protein
MEVWNASANSSHEIVTDIKEFELRTLFVFTSVRKVRIPYLPFAVVGISCLGRRYYSRDMIEIRKATAKDVPAIYAMGENVDEFHTSDQAPNFWPEAILRECVNKDDVYFFVAATKA